MTNLRQQTEQLRHAPQPEVVELTARQYGKPHIKWLHVDGPLLVCSDGTLHFLTFWDRLWLWCNLITVNDLNNKHVPKPAPWPDPTPADPLQPWVSSGGIRRPQEGTGTTWEGSEGQGRG